MSNTENLDIEVSHDLSFIESAILLQNKVFGEVAPSIYNNKSEWQKKIANGGYFIACVSQSEILGFAVCNITETGDFKIWLAGVSSEARGQGLWTLMFADIVKHARTKGYSYILLNTFPQKFPVMFAFLKKQKAEIYKEETVNGSQKVYGKISI